MKRTLTSKMVKTGIKNGFTVKDFCAKYDIGGEAAFVEQLHKAFPATGPDWAIREIRKNEKNRKPKKKVAATKNATKVVPKTACSTSNTPKKGDDKIVTKQDTLKQLKETEATLSSEVINLENQHKQLAGERREYLKKLRDVQQKVDEIFTELEKLQANYEGVALEANEIIKQMNQISAVHAEKLNNLTSVREQISKLETIVIAVYNNCNFEIVEGNNISLETEESEVNALTYRLMEEKICEDLTVKQVKTLSKLALITSRNADQKFDFIFDSNVLEKAYLASKPLSF